MRQKIFAMVHNRMKERPGLVHRCTNLMLTPPPISEVEAIPFSVVAALLPRRVCRRVVNLVVPKQSATSSKMMAWLMLMMWTTMAKKDCSYYVEKRQFSDHQRFFVVTGLSGTVVEDFGNFLIEKGARPFERSLDAVALTPHERSARTILSARRDLVTELQKESGMVLLSAEVYGTNFSHLDIHLLAALAEVAEVDLRIAVIDCSAETLMTGPPPTRGALVASLADNAALLAVHLENLDPSFIVRVTSCGDLSKLHPAFFTSNCAAGDEIPAEVDDVYLDRVAAMTDVILRRTLGGHTNHTKRYAVRKTVFDDKRRFLFVVGLEGTGHHGLTSLFKAMAAAANETTFRFADDRDITAGVYKGPTKPTGAFVYPDDIDPKAIRQRRDQLRMNMETIPCPTSTCLFGVNTLKTTLDTGEMSFPNFRGTFREYHHVDLLDFARIAEEANADLRFLVLARSAEDILVSTTEHRHFASHTSEAGIEALNAAAIAADLALIDPAFVLCLPWDVVENKGRAWFQRNLSLATWTHIATRLHPSFTADIMRDALRAAHVAFNDDLASIEDDFLQQTRDHQPRSPINASAFALRRDPGVAHLQVSADSFYRVAGCGCGA